MKQKFKRYQFVNVDKEDATHRSHKGGFAGIISGTYSDEYGGKNINSYTIYKIGDKGQVVDCCSWYEEWQLRLWSYQDAEMAGNMIEAYNFRD